MVKARRIVSSIMPERERDETTGLYAEKAPLDAVLDVFGRVRGPVVTSSDVAEHLDCTTETARRKLKELYDQGAVDKRTTGRTTVWWVTGGERIMPDERASTADAENARPGREERREHADGPDTTHDDTADEDTTAPTSTETDSDTETTDNNSGVYDPTDEFDD
jgi:hypothetical protein